VAVAELEAALASELVKEEETHVLFDGPHDVERWDVRSRHGGVSLERWAYQGPPQATEDGSALAPSGPTRDRFVLLSLRRGNKIQLMHASLEPAAGDVAAVAVHSAELDEAHADLRALGWLPHVEEEVAA
jgi:hypothetical protein